jgi:hypothetical protein
MDTTLRNVADQNNTTSPLKLSTTAVQVESPLRITTSDASGFYLDAEDSATNNRFSIKRDPSSQEVTLDFASNPAGSTTLVGAIRTYQDGVNLSNAMSFIEDGSVGIGTNTPIGILHLKRTAANTRLVIDGDAGFNRLISYRTAGLQRFGLYVNNTAESGSNAGSDFAVRAYSDAGTLLNTPVFIKRSTGNVGINTITGTAKLQVVGSGSTSATTSLLVQNSGGTSLLTINDAGTSTFNGNIVTTTLNSGYYSGTNNNVQGALGATCLGDGGVALGRNATADTNCIALGGNARTTGSANSVALGAFSTAVANTFVMGSSGGTYDNIYFGSGIDRTKGGGGTTLGAGSSYAINGSGANGTDFAGGNLTIAGGKGTGSGIAGDVIFSTSTTAVSSNTLQTLTNRWWVKGTTGTLANVSSPDASAALQADSTTQGFLPPRMTNAQRAAIVTPAVGLMVYCTDVVEGLYVYKSTGWTFVI